jgi:hypothetical protein
MRAALDTATVPRTLGARDDGHGIVGGEQVPFGEHDDVRLVVQSSGL